MRKAIVIVALILLLAGIVLAVSIQESHPEEIILDKWDPITPPELQPTPHPENLDRTGWNFMALTSDGTFLELNINASDVVRVIIGTLVADEYGNPKWEKATFNETRTRFTQRVNITETNANLLEIQNEGTNIVNISGNIKKLGDIRRTSYPYLGLGTLAAVFGLILSIYGVSAKPKKKRFKGKSRTSTL